jgi:very-short-patch-repair endonuclease
MGYEELKEEIPKKYWEICKICDMPLNKMEKRSGQYLPQRFFEHLRDVHNLSIENYLEIYENIVTPFCPCNCGERTGINKKFTSKMSVNKYIRFHSTASDPKFKESVERSKISRLGSGNPMFGKDPWNKGLNKETSPIINRIAEKRIGSHHTEESKEKMSESAKKRLVHGHTGHKHSEETKRIIAQKTIEAIQRGVFSHTKSKPHVAMALILDELGIKYKEEESIDYWLFDFFLVDYNIYLEVDGDYFHVNPKFYPDGPKTKTQKVNFYRDKKKNQFCKDNQIAVIRCWENEIINQREEIKIKIKEFINESSENSKN